MISDNWPEVAAAGWPPPQRVLCPTHLVQDVDVERRRAGCAADACCRASAAAAAAGAAVRVEQRSRGGGHRNHRLVSMVATLVRRGHWHHWAPPAQTMHASQKASQGIT